ncbi:EAL domain-containing protein [Pseudoalteromonas sp. MelDa3]|uniref:EAL domain-containing protein n=1 Tax=Pseudoalteromonas sp. MelDa3 TaxID=888435 RepID=UPI000CC2C283|nr:EAL domain-containing protein [Pseudoalteromonas sp. MelDa3]PLT25267.1 diguanylate phosphodiesterase [Pseudoalteromonas sp. MelDa3]
MSDSNSLFVFDEEQEIDGSTLVRKIKVFTVEDDLNYQHALTNSLKEIKPEDNCEIEILTANSVSQAALVLSLHPDIALTFIDVVMEDDDSGLRLVSTIREVIGNADMRIVLLTGQPGFAPEQQIMKSLDIDEYWNKSDVSAEKLQSIVTSNLRTWKYITQISSARKGLQLVLDASRSINSKHDMRSFSKAVLVEISNILNVTEGGGIMCSTQSDGELVRAHISSANGCFDGFEGKLVDNNILLPEIYTDFKRALDEKTHIFSEHHTVFYFCNKEITGESYITIVQSDNEISEQNEYLLKVFSENVSTGFSNIALLNKLTELAYTDVSLNMHNRNWLTREIRNMNLHEQYQTRLFVFEVEQFEEKAFTFGHDFCQKLLKEVYNNLITIFDGYSARIAIINNSSFGLIVNANFDITDEMIASLIRQKCVITSVKQYADLRILDLALSSVLNIIPEKIISIAESSLNDSQSASLKYIKHTQEKTEALTNRYSLMARLRRVIGAGSLQVALQPKMDLVKLTPVGFEALARWQLDDGSFVSPEVFIELAETAGLISELDSVVFDKIISTIHKLSDIGVNLPIAFNASAFDLVDPDYCQKILHKLKDANISPEMLELEITETQAISNYDLIRESLDKFMALGIKVSIDDFGTGYSSISHITEIPANTLKIDRCFINDIESNANNQYILEMIVNLAKRFNFSIIVEGIETREQCEWVKTIGCNVAQGYYFSKPLFFDDLIEWLKQYGKV